MFNDDIHAGLLIFFFFLSRVPRSQLYTLKGNASTFSKLGICEKYVLFESTAYTDIQKYKFYVYACLIPTDYVHDQKKPRYWYLS
jgi:hypothetical protein